MIEPRPVRVVVVGNHVRLFYGQIYMHSEEYASHSGAKRAAKGLIKAINTSPMTLEYTHRDNWVIEAVRKLWMGGNGRLVVLPVDGGPDAAVGPYSEPT